MIPAKAILLDPTLFPYLDVVGFFDWIWERGVYGINGIVSVFDKDNCPSSPSTNGLHNFIPMRTQVDGQIGNYYVCEYCGKSAGEVGEEAYAEQVSTLPAPEYGSDGSVYVVPTKFLFKHVDTSVHIATLSNGQTHQDTYYFVSAGLPTIHFEMLRKLKHSGSSCSYSVEVQHRTPFACSAEVLVSSATFSTNKTSGDLTYSSDSQKYDSGSTYSLTFTTPKFSPVKDAENYLTIENYVNFYLNDLRIKFTPISSLSDTTYNTTTRPTTITGGNYGIVGDNGQITSVTNNTSIVNETNNTYYNPATGNSDMILSWTYDYSDRSYHITLESGDTVTVTYGNQNITIVEGDTTYNVYYIINSDGSGSGSGGGSADDTPPHTHNWQETSRKEPTCTAPGQILYTCSECSQTQTEVLKATGHTWQLDHTVQNSYDSDGNLIQQGYTLYICSSCGQQYTDTTGAGPPSGSGGSSDDGESIWEKIGNLIGGIFSAIVDFITGILGKILDALISLGELIIGKLASVVGVVLSIFDQVPALFGGFLDFLSVIFPFFPPEITLVLTFGIVALVFVGIIKAIRR